MATAPRRRAGAASSSSAAEQLYGGRDEMEDALPGWEMLVLKSGGLPDANVHVQHGSPSCARARGGGGGAGGEGRGVGVAGLTQECVFGVNAGDWRPR